MKYTKIIALGVLLIGMAAEGRAQVFQVFKKDMNTAKFQATEVDSISYNDAEGLTTIHLRNGSKQTFQKTVTDSIVWYDPTNSILSTLRKKGNFTYILRLLEESSRLNLYSVPWMEDKLNGATDQTVFAANDDSWKRFFAENAKLPETNPWHTVTSYDALTADQKRALLGISVTQARKIGEMGKQDFLRMWGADGTNEGVWTPILTSEYCALHNITEADQRIICSAPISVPWMPGADIIDADIACTNGYIEEVSTPLTPLATMADIIRGNGQTDIFAHIIDYIQQNQNSDPNGYGVQLKFDPSWAGYYDEVAPERDMAAMFVPNDDAMWRFFTKGAGQALLQAYINQTGTEGEPVPYTKPTTKEELCQQIDCIPLSVIQTFINTIMMRSFVGSVPSKMLKLKDDAMEQLFYPEDIEKIDTCLWASNGVVYVMDKVYGPSSDYTSITAPAYMSTTNQIMKWAIYDNNNLGLNYYAYLKVPQQDITLFLPSDDAMLYYYDPISMKSKTPRVIQMTYKNVSSGRVAVVATCYKYIDPYGINPASDETPIGSIGNKLLGSAGSVLETDITNRLKNILLNHTIINDGTQDINSRNEYYRTFGGDVVKVLRDESGRIVGAKGTFQIENERNGITTVNPGVTGCNVTASYESLTNGQTYTLDAPLVSTYRSLWSMLTDDLKETERYNPKGYTDEAWQANPYRAFYELCMPDGDMESVIMGCGLVDANLSVSERNAAMKKYLPFTSNNGLDYNFAPLNGNTPYTAYIPTNEAVQRAIAMGLPTWQEIFEDYQSHCKPELDDESGQPAKDENGDIIFSDKLEFAADSIRITNKIIALTNVIKAHFHYGMAIADKESFRGEYKSLVIDPETLSSPTLTVQGLGEGVMTVTDWKGHTFNVLDNKNVFVCDYTCYSSPRGYNMPRITIDSRRPGVIHQIDGVIGF
ncbi:MAG: hypothetical protein J6W52_12040 [Bacteroidaceae bacterium]|nr:hypothetical protein [Bacteroidaceae bacterium]